MLKLIYLFFLTGLWATPDSGESITFGQSAATQGPAEQLGNQMRIGIMAAFKQQNDQRGVHNHKLRLKTLNDGYEPNKAIANANTFVNDKNIFAMIGGVGTPTAHSIEPITSQNKVPFIGPFTGAEFLRSPFKRYVVNIRGSYWQETESWIEHLTKNNIKRIAIFYQDDSYGLAGYTGVKKALERRNMDVVGEGTYLRNTTAVKTALLRIKKSKPEAVVMIGAYKPCAEFIKLCKKINFSPLFLNISFVGSKALANQLQNQGEGVIISQVVPLPTNTDLEIIRDYQRDLKKYFPTEEPGFVSLEGYLSGRFVIEVLKSLKPSSLDRESFINQIYKTKDYDLGGFKLTFDDNNNQGSNQIYLTKISADKSFVEIQG